MTANPRFDWIVLFILVAVWGSAFALLQVAVAAVHPIWTSTGRLIVATAVLLALMAVLKERMPAFSERRLWMLYTLIGVVGTALPFFLFAWASQRADSAVVAICNGGSPFFTAAFAHALTSEKITWRRAVGIGLGFAGLVALVAPDAMSAEGAPQTLGVAAAVTGAACYGIANVWTKAAPPVPATTGAAMFCMTAAAASLPIALLSGPALVAGAPPSDPTTLWALAAVVALGVFATGLSSIGYVFLIQRRGAVYVSLVTYLMPLWAAMLAVVFLHERLGPNVLVALVLVVAGMVASNWTPRRERVAA